jgi:uncharacterized membrane protein YbhN (UPF0104 family)
MPENNQTPKKKLFLSIIKVAWTIAVLAGGIYYIVKNYASAIQYLQTINPAKLIIAFLLIIVVRLLNVDLVQRSLMLVGWKPNFKLAFSFVSISQLGKYIPGGFWQFVARFSAYKENEVSYKNMGKAFIVENVWMVFGLFFISMFFIFISGPVVIFEKIGIVFSSTQRILLALGCVVLWLLTLLIIEYLFKSTDTLPFGKSVSTQFLSQTVMWIVSGISFYCLFNQAFSLNALFYSIGAFGLSFLAGYVVIIAPGGIGVREYVAVLLFDVMVSGSNIGILTIVHRLLYTLVEFLLAGIAALISKSSKALSSSEMK